MPACFALCQVALPHHWPYGYLHVDGGHSGLRGAVFCLRRQHGVWEASEVLEAGSWQSVLQQPQRMGHSCARRLGGVQTPNGTALCVAVVSPLCVALVGVGPVQCVGVGSLKDGVSNAVLLSLFQHNLCCDNCHSHVALALNLMRYDNSTSWNMVKLCFFSLLYGKYVR
uniref:Uncharacterized protein n=1 Tax=Meleagris gallopavo TaxID=9103 RepID=A0A803XN94_MELGA